jgi:hypothetical protein
MFESSFYLVAGMQFVGIASVVASRLCESRRFQTATQTLFFVVLLAMGLTTVSALAVGTGLGLFCGAMLSVMTVGATLDLRSQPASSAF